MRLEEVEEIGMLHEISHRLEGTEEVLMRHRVPVVAAIAAGTIPLRFGGNDGDGGWLHGTRQLLFTAAGTGAGAALLA